MAIGGTPGARVMAVRGDNAVTSSGFSNLRPIWLQLWLVLVL